MSAWLTPPARGWNPHRDSTADAPPADPAVLRARAMAEMDAFFGFKG